MDWSSFFLGQPAGVGQVNRFVPQQQNTLSSLMNMGMQGMQNPYAGFEPIANQARTQFQQQTLPSIMERFQSLGNNAMSSGALKTELGQAGANLEGGLAALQSQYGMQNRNQMLNMLGLGLTPQLESYATQGQEGLLQQILPALSSVGMNALGAGLTGGMSAIAPSIGSILKMMASAPYQQKR